MRMRYPYPNQLWSFADLEPNRSEKNDSKTNTADSETKSRTKPGDSATTIQKPKQPIQKPSQEPSQAIQQLRFRNQQRVGTMAKIITLDVVANGRSQHRLNRAPPRPGEKALRRERAVALRSVFVSVIGSSVFSLLN